MIPPLAFGASGFLIAYLLDARFSSQEKGDWYLFAIASGAAAFGVSFLFWRIFCRSRPKISGRRGALVGMLTGVFAHPVAQYLMIVILYASGARSSLGDRTVNPLAREALAGAFLYAGMAILFTGWLTVPVGGLLGWILGKALRPR